MIKYESQAWGLITIIVIEGTIPKPSSAFDSHSLIMNNAGIVEASNAKNRSGCLHMLRVHDRVTALRKGAMCQTLKH